MQNVSVCCYFGSEKYFSTIMDSLYLLCVMIFYLKLVLLSLSLVALSKPSKRQDEVQPGCELLEAEEPQGPLHRTIQVQSSARDALCPAFGRYMSPRLVREAPSDLIVPFGASCFAA